MYKLKRELKNCLWGSLFLLLALTAMLLINNNGAVNAYETDSDRAVLVSTETISK